MYETYTDNANYAADDIARYENVTKEDVMRVYRTYIKDQPAVVMSVVPEGQGDLIAAEDTWERYERTLPDYLAVDESALELRVAVDDFDRSLVPPAGDNPQTTVPDIWRAELDNGIPVLGAMNAETPTVALRLRIDAGQRDEPLDKLGLAALTAAMLNESTTERSNEELSNALQKLGGTVRIAAGNDSTQLTVRSLSENLEETLAIAAERLLSPAFDTADFERVKAQTLQGIRQTRTQPGPTADTVYQQLLFGEENSFSYLNIGVEETVSTIELDDVKQFYAEHYSPAIASIIAVGDQQQAEVLERLAVFADWTGPDVSRKPLNPFPDLQTSTLYLVDKPDAAQSEIRIGKRSLAFDATGEQYRAKLMNFALGGAFNSRINLNLREDKGYSYGARSGFNGNRDYGSFTASAAVRSETTADSIVQFEDEIRRYAESGISESELTFTRRAIGQQDARKYETPSQKLNFLADILVYDLEPSFVDEQNAILAGIDEEEINALAARHLDMESMIIVVVGDKASILPELKELGYDIVELDASGREIGRL